LYSSVVSTPLKYSVIFNVLSMLLLYHGNLSLKINFRGLYVLNNDKKIKIVENFFNWMNKMKLEEALIVQNFIIGGGFHMAIQTNGTSKQCVTCQHFTGARTTDAVKRNVQYDAGAKGSCVKTKMSKSANQSSCPKWERWSALK